jgi:prevent-host-death family protein
VSAVNIAQAKAQLSAWVARAEAGEAVEIMRRGKPAALLVAARTRREPVDAVWLKALTDSMPLQAGPDGVFVREMRDSDRY